MKALDLAGVRFEKLTCIECVGTKHGSRLWKCKCDCGNEINAKANNLRNGNTKSCGCLSLKHPIHTRNRGGDKPTTLVKKGYKLPKQGEWILRPGWYWPEFTCAKGHDAPRNRFTHCMQCVREYRKTRDHFINERLLEWRKENKDKININRVMYNKNNPIKRMLSSAKKVAKSKNILFNLKEEDIFIPEFCPVFGMRLEPSFKQRKDSSISLDRIVPSLGYVKGNVLVVSWRANELKKDASIDELIRLAEFYKGLR